MHKRVRLIIGLCLMSGVVLEESSLKFGGLSPPGFQEAAALKFDEDMRELLRETNPKGIYRTTNCQP